jgi:phosphoglycerate dehydrogenase-like enzyme
MSTSEHHAGRLLLPERYRDVVGHAPALAGRIDWYSDAAGAMDAAAKAGALWLDYFDPALVAQTLDVGRNLRWVFTPEVGVDRYPLDRFVRQGVTLCNGVGIFDTPIAEHTVMLILAARRGLPGIMREQRAGRWTRPPVPADLAGSQAIIFGFGSIGSAIGERLRALGVRVTGVRRSADAASGVIASERWRELLPDADWVILSAPLTPDTVCTIGAAELAAMKSTSWLVNVGRGRLVDTAALVAALSAGEIGGAALDVTNPEPLPAGHPLWSPDNVIITPHASWLSQTTPGRLAERFLANLERSDGGRPLIGGVDFSRLGKG